MSAADIAVAPTPPSPPIPAWATALQRDVRELRKLHYELRRDHSRLKSKQAADAMAAIHLLSGVGESVEVSRIEILKLLNKQSRQFWGAMKQLRARIKPKGKGKTR